MIIKAPTRLHLGLIHPSCPQLFSTSEHERCYGGLGLMLDRPSIEIRINRSYNWTVDGHLSPRVAYYIKRLRSHFSCLDDNPRKVTVLACPDIHIGLGVGTQLALAVGTSILYSQDYKVSTIELAKLLFRGKRSGIGVHGFDYGGMIVEYGKHFEQSISPLVSCIRLPPEWCIMLLRPHHIKQRWFGSKERKVLADYKYYDADRIMHLLELGILPAARMGDFKIFSELVYEYNYLCGLPFKRYQNGEHSLEASEIMLYLKKLGLIGCGQSSWGPTVYAIVENEYFANKLARLLNKHFLIDVSSISSGYEIIV